MGLSHHFKPTNFRNISAKIVQCFTKLPMRVFFRIMPRCRFLCVTKLLSVFLCCVAATC